VGFWWWFWLRLQWWLFGPATDPGRGIDPIVGAPAATPWYYGAQSTERHGETSKMKLNTTILVAALTALTFAVPACDKKEEKKDDKKADKKAEEEKKE
jgi:hypothetical protein